MLTKKELYQLTKEMLYEKFGGRCAFCGHGLGERWHIWHMEPRNTLVTIKGEIILGNDSYENKLPACISCNSTRINNSGCKEVKINIEQFRQALYDEFSFLRTSSMASTYYKKALKYGLIIETEEQIVFYFESLIKEKKQ